MLNSYAVVPGRGVGPFELGMSGLPPPRKALLTEKGDTLWHILDLIRTERTRFPKAELAWDTAVSLPPSWMLGKGQSADKGQKAHTSDLTLSLPHLTLYFPHPAQQLSLLKINAIPSSTLTLSYEDQVLHSSTQALTRGVIGRVLGPTHSGNSGSLVYPGIKLEVATSQRPSSRDDKIETLTVLAREQGSSVDGTPLNAVTVKVCTAFVPPPFS